MIVCIDIGGGTTRIGFSTDIKTFEKIVRFPTLGEFDNGIQQIIEEIMSYCPEIDIEKIVVAVAGSVDRNKGSIIKWGQKQSWWGKNIFQPLSKAFPHASLYIENDANIGALGEAVFGAGKDHLLVGYITLSTGIGGSLIVNKQILPHHFGIEPAHQIVNTNETEVWSCGQKGCFESYASGTAFKKIFGISPEDCEVQEVWDRYAKLISVGIANVVVLWSPDILIIGGGVSHKFDKFIVPLKNELNNLLPVFEVPLLVKSRLDEPGLYGGLVYSS